MKRLVAALAGVAFATAAALADEKHHKPAAGAPAAAESPAAMAEGEIRRVDKDAKKLTIRHGPLASLDMPAMTMVFQVRDPVMLEQVKAGDKVRFEAEKVGGAYIVTRIEPAR